MFPPTASDFKNYFVREFVYGDGFDSVTDNDLTRAINEANDGSYFSVNNWDNVSQQTIAFLYLAAHLLVMNIQQMAGGLSAIPRGRGVRNAGEGVQVAKGIGAANVTYQVPPQRVAESATLLYFFMTSFGQRYMKMIEPRLVGNMAVVAGPNDQTQPDPNNPI